MSATKGFAQAQAHAVGDEPKGLVAMAGGAADEAGDFIAGQDIGQGTNAWWLDHVDPRERLAEHVLVEEADAVAVDLHRAPGMGVDQIREVAFEFVGGEVVGDAIDILRESAHGEGIGFDGFRGFALELEGGKVLLVGGIETKLILRIHDGSPRVCAPGF